MSFFGIGHNGQIGQVLWPLATVASVAIGGRAILRRNSNRATRVL